MGIGASGGLILRNRIYSAMSVKCYTRSAFCVLLSLFLILMSIAPAMSVYAENTEGQTPSEQNGDTPDNINPDPSDPTEKRNSDIEEKTDPDKEANTDTDTNSDTDTEKSDEKGQRASDTPKDEKEYVAAIGDDKFLTLQDAIDAAKDGDKILLLSDLKESVKLVKKNVTIDGQNHSVRGNGGSVFYTSNGKVTLENMTITDGNGEKGGGVNSWGTTLTIKNCNIVNNKATYGAGLYTDNAAVTIDRTNIDNNIAEGNGGAYYIYMSGAKNISISNSSICNNKANRAGAINACLYAAVNFKVTNTKINNNQSDGGMFGTVSLNGYKDPTCTFTGGEIVGNTGYAAGGIEAKGVHLYITGTKITKNHAVSTDEDAAGGIKADAFSSGTIFMSGGVVEGNTTAGSGKANDVYIDKNVSNVQLPRPSQMDVSNPEAMAWRDETNDTITKEGISGQRSIDRFLTLVNEEILVNGLYIDGVNGNDEGDGALEHPIKTLDKAKELLAKNKLDSIKVLNTITVSEDVDMAGATLIRAEEFASGSILSIAKDSNVTMTNTVVDGNREADVSVAAAAVIVNRGATLTLDKGAVVQNNAISVANRNIKPGGIDCFGDLIMNDGAVVRNNKGTIGGGVRVDNGNFTMNGGEITENIAVELSYDSYDYCYGGGVLLIRGAKMTMNGGSIHTNDADGSGGGISLGHRHSSSVTNNGTVSFEMNGGTISNNYARNAGGGLMVQCSTIAELKAGTISDNIAQGGRCAHAGGGIYVNGYHEETLKELGIEHGRLYVYNTEISGNDASALGGAIACCGTGHGLVGNHQGTVIFDNKNGNKEKADIFFDGLEWTPLGNDWWSIRELEELPYTSYVSAIMLNGGKYNWTDPEGNAVDVEKLAQINKAIKLKTAATATDTDVKESLKMATVHITGNKSHNNGGGIGCNGIMYFGDAVESAFEEPPEIPEEKTEVKGAVELSENEEDIAVVKGAHTGDERDMAHLIVLMLMSAVSMMVIGGHRRNN